MFVLSLTACSRGEKTRGEKYLYAKYVYLKRLPYPVFQLREKYTRDKGHGGTKAVETDDME